MDRLFFNIVSFVLALLVYIFLVLLFLGQFFHLHKPQRIEIKAQAIDVFIETPQKTQKVVPVKKIEKSSAPKPKKRGSSSPKQRSSNVKNLFAKLDTKSLKRPKPKRSETPSKYKGHGGKKAEELLKKLKLKEFEPKSKRSIKSVEGKQDPYLQKVYKILYSYWIPSKESAGNRAIVQITIDRYGNFSYKVLQYSQNEIFNQELEEFLEAMKMKEFPHPKQKRTMTVLFEAKE